MVDARFGVIFGVIAWVIAHAANECPLAIGKFPVTLRTELR